MSRRPAIIERSCEHCGDVLRCCRACEHRLMKLDEWPQRCAEDGGRYRRAQPRRWTRPTEPGCAFCPAASADGWTDTNKETT